MASRTPFHREVLQALRLAARFEATRTPTAEGLERIAAAGWTRRRFLRAAAVAAAGATAGAPRLARWAWAADAAGPEVVIVGAGLAGLTCAYRLQQHGVPARVIDAGTRVGGRVYSLRNHFPDGQATELGAEFIDSDHTALRALARELGLAVVDLAYAGGTQGNVYAFEGKVIPTDSHLIDAFRPVARRILEDLGEEGENCDVRWDHGTPAGKMLDRLSIAEWLKSRGFEGTLIAKVLEIAYVGEYGLDPGEQSSLNLLCFVGTEPSSFALYGESDERFHVAAGNDAVAQRLAQELARPVELGTELRAIRTASDGRYELAVARGAATDTIKAGTVVLALPFTLLRRVEIGVELPAVKRRAIQELGYGTNAKLICGFQRRVWSEAGFSGATFSDLGYQACWETSRGQAGSHGILTNFLGGKAGARLGDGEAGEHARRFAAQLDRVFPGVARAFTGEAVRFVWPTSRWAQGSYTCYRPGQYAAIAGAEGFAVGGLHFCGEHTSGRFTGFMNGAVESGERAAREILD